MLRHKIFRTHHSKNEGKEFAQTMRNNRFHDVPQHDLPSLSQATIEPTRSRSYTAPLYRGPAHKNSKPSEKVPVPYVYNHNLFLNYEPVSVIGRLKGLIRENNVIGFSQTMNKQETLSEEIINDLIHYATQLSEERNYEKRLEQLSEEYANQQKCYEDEIKKQSHQTTAVTTTKSGYRISRQAKIVSDNIVAINDLAEMQEEIDKIKKEQKNQTAIREFLFAKKSMLNKIAQQPYPKEEKPTKSSIFCCLG